MNPCDGLTGAMRQICEGTRPGVSPEQRAGYVWRWEQDGRLPAGSLKALGLPQPPSRGLGDTVRKITHATGLDKIAKAVERVTGKPCGCGKRQERLNRAVPYRRP